MSAHDSLEAIAGRLTAERDEARAIVRDIHWMARRYADGRQSYAAGMFNDAVRKAYEAGWLEHTIADEPAYARDGMFSAEWRSIEQRALDAEAALRATIPTTKET